MQVKFFVRKSQLGLISLLLLAISCVSTRKSGTASQPEWEDLFVGASTDKLRGYKMTEFPNDSWIVEDNTLRA
jgi:hypothetical protein